MSGYKRSFLAYGRDAVNNFTKLVKTEAHFHLNAAVFQALILPTMLRPYRWYIISGKLLPRILWQTFQSAPTTRVHSHSSFLSGSNPFNIKVRLPLLHDIAYPLYKYYSYIRIQTHRYPYRNPQILSKVFTKDTYSSPGSPSNKLPSFLIISHCVDNPIELMVVSFA